MKRVSLIAFLLLAASLSTFAQEYKVITIVESIVPAGLGRSRIVENQGLVNIDQLTTEREGNKSSAGDVKRNEIKASGENLKETKILNFYSLTGINFENIAANDAVIAAKMNEMISKGWQLITITSGVESDAGKDDGNGLFITRMYFKKG